MRAVPRQDRLSILSTKDSDRLSILSTRDSDRSSIPNAGA